MTPSLYAVRTLESAAALSVLCLLAAVDPAIAGSAGLERRVVVAWNEWPQGPGWMQTMSVLPPWSFEGSARQIDTNATLRFANGLIYVVQPVTIGIDVFEPIGLTPVRSYALNGTCQARDIAVVSSSRAYVSCAESLRLLRLDLVTGEVTSVVSFVIYTDSDGLPDVNMMAVFEGRLFVQLQRIHSINHDGFTPPAMLAVVDIATEGFVDADPSTPGTQAIELVGTPPKFKMQVVPETRRLFVSATGDFFDSGGIEMIDLDSLQTLGLVVAENDDTTGADLGAFALVTPQSGYLTYSTDLLLSSHLHRFTLADGVEPGPDLHQSLNYFVPTLLHDPVTQLLFYPEGTPEVFGVRVFDATTGELLTPEPIATTGPPTDMIFVCNAENCGTAPTVPTTSSVGLAVLSGLLILVGTLVFIRLPGSTNDLESAA